uniref:Salp15-like protein n=1 Tax=Ixodes ricinus TaxID=34613 RepID=W6ICA9_IXORI|nr:salp15-like protein [Ixodes ricinus]
MKVVCIILLFVIAAATESVEKDAKPPGTPKGKTRDTVTLRFPKYISNHKKLAGELVDICQNYTKTQKLSLNSSEIKINDNFVSFKNCTFLCKYGSSNVTLEMPRNTQCGPDGQTCADKTRCVEHIPGC